MNWNISRDIPNGPEGFTFAILNGETVIAWVKTEADADFIVSASSKISSLEDEVSWLEGEVSRSRWLGASGG